MANSFSFKDKTFSIGDTVSLSYKIKEGEKERTQKYSGIIIKVKGQKAEDKTFTLRRISKTGIGVERIIPISSPYLVDMKVSKKTGYKKAKLYLIRNLSQQEIKHKIYRHIK